VPRICCGCASVQSLLALSTVDVRLGVGNLDAAKKMVVVHWWTWWLGGDVVKWQPGGNGDGSGVTVSGPRPAGRVVGSRPVIIISRKKKETKK
jgi:hypothetical protein